MVARAPLTRRGVLLGGAGLAAAAVAGCGPFGRRLVVPRTNEQIAYGTEHPDQHGFFGLPARTPKALVVLIHGGYWFTGFGADLMDAASLDLRRRGYAVWNIEYRRTAAGGGWPTTFTDVALAVDHVTQLPLDHTLPVVLLGHSAGGHLAVWAASRTDKTPGGASKVTIDRTYSLSGVLNLAVGETEHLGNGAITLLMGGSAVQFPERYDLGDPTRLVPAHSPVTAFHALEDELVPMSQSISYVAADRAAGGNAQFAKVPGSHLQLVQTDKPAWQIIRQVLDRDLGH